VIVAGATGFAGSQILKSALANPQISGVVAISRRELSDQPPNEKLKVVLLQDFENYSGILHELEGCTACLWAIGGKAQDFKSPEEYHKISYDFTVAAAKAFSSLPHITPANPFTFLYLSGKYADQSERDDLWFMTATRHMKGKTEKALVDIVEHNPETFKLRIFRPGGILPADSSMGHVMEGVFPSLFISTSDLAKAMVDVTVHEQPHEKSIAIFENNQIVERSAGVHF